MIKILVGLGLLVGFFLSSVNKAWAVSIAEQTQNYSSSLNVWQTMQELGNNLSGTASTFTFRVSTSRTNLNQFDYTTRNTRIYDKDNNNSYIIGCPGTNHNDPLDGLTFTTTDVQAGYENVTIDFSCRNYSFIPGHRYLIFITNANMGNQSSGKILFAAAAYSGTSNDYFTGGGLRYAFDNSSCSASSYIWNSSSANAGCNIFGSTKADLYFVLNNNAPPPKLPVIFIPGIGGSEFKATQDIIWSDADGHGGTYSHAYATNEKIWVNQNEAANLGNDDYFDVLRLKADGVTPEADLSLTGNLVSNGYSQIDSFFTDMGYVKGTNYFVFPYDWRKDVRSTKDSLDALIESAKTASGQPQVNLVVHSMGGLIARYYISDSGKAAKVNKLIELGVPHLGAVSALKTLMYGTRVGPSYLFGLIALNINEVKDVAQNLTSNFELLPSNQYFSFYNNSNNDYLYPFRDDRDIDNNTITGPLSYNQNKTLLSNLNYNTTIFNLGEQFHNSLDSTLNQTNGTKVYEIVGASQPTLGQIYETWWATWPVNLFNKTDEIFINGDGTVPLYSASLKNDSLDLSGATKIYYVEQEHGKLVENNGTAMQTVKAILNDDNSLPVEVKNEKIVLEGEQLSLDDGELDLYDDQNRHCGLNVNQELEENIPEVSCTTSGNTKHAFVKKKAAKVKVKVTRRKPATSSKTTNLKKRTYKQDKVSKTAIYKDIALDEKGKLEFDLDPSADISPSLTLYPDSTKPDNQIIVPTSEASGGPALDQTSPKTTVQISGSQNSSGIYTGPATITLTGSDTDSGILRIEYSLDNGQTVQIYTQPFTVSAPGTTTIQIKSIDKVGNEEIPQTVTVQIAASATQTPTSTSTSSSTNSSSSSPSTSGESPSTSLGTSKPTSSPAILGVSTDNFPDQQKEIITAKKTYFPAKEILGGLLKVSGGIIALASFGLALTFFKPTPK